jgi:hypothetical protein
VLEFAVPVSEGEGDGFEFFLQDGDLAVEGVDLPFLLSALSDLEAVDLLSQHEDAVFGEGLGCVERDIRW